MPFRVGLAPGALSGYESFEGLDPAEWVPRGYAIVNCDARGALDCEGTLAWSSSQASPGRQRLSLII